MNAFKDLFLSRRAKPQYHDSQLLHRCTTLGETRAQGYAVCGRAGGTTRLGSPQRSAAASSVQMKMKSRGVWPSPPPHHVQRAVDQQLPSPHAHGHYVDRVKQVGRLLPLCRHCVAGFV